MAIPINKTDNERFLKLAELITINKDLRSKLSPGTSAEMQIYTSDHPQEGITYVSLEISGYVPTAEAEKVFGSAVEDSPQ